MRHLYKIAALTFIGLLAVILLVFVFSPDTDYSPQEKRKLAQKPEFSWEGISSGKFMDGMEDYLADQFPGRFGCMNLKTSLLKMIGKRESQGVYYCKDDSLVEKFTLPPLEKRKALLQELQKFSKENPKVQFYFMLVPNGVSVKKEELPDHAITDDQNAYMDELFTALKGQMKPIDVRKRFEKLKNRKQLYYRTDHHWTTEGAYEAFQVAAKAMGIQNPGEFELKTVCNDFNGSLTAKSGFSVLKPDAIQVGFEKAAEKTLYTVTYSEENKRVASCYQTEALKGDDPYQIFFGGNHPLLEIDTAAPGDQRILILKDSYANAFIPFLIPLYKKITVVDPRYYYDDIDALMGQGFDTVLFLYNANTLSTDSSLEVVLENNQ